VGDVFIRQRLCPGEQCRLEARDVARFVHVARSRAPAPRTLTTRSSTSG
jgi:hypothetical protein